MGAQKAGTARDQNPFCIVRHVTPVVVLDQADGRWRTHTRSRAGAPSPIGPPTRFRRWTRAAFLG
jgi:hypothetical protein